MAENETMPYSDDMEIEVPSDAGPTVKRLWKSMGRQRIRLIVVSVSVVFYTILSVAGSCVQCKDRRYALSGG